MEAFFAWMVHGMTCRIREFTMYNIISELIRWDLQMTGVSDINSIHSHAIALSPAAPFK